MDSYVDRELLKIWIGVGLSIVALLLVWADRKESTEISETKTPVDEQVLLNDSIDSLLTSFGIGSVRKKEVQLQDGQFVRYERYVRVPKTLSLAELNRALSKLARDFNLDVTAREDLKNTRVTMHFSSQRQIIQTIILQVAL